MMLNRTLSALMQKTYSEMTATIDHNFHTNTSRSFIWYIKVTIALPVFVADMFRPRQVVAVCECMTTQHVLRGTSVVEASACCIHVFLVIVWDWLGTVSDCGDRSEDSLCKFGCKFCLMNSDF